jgi:hypothetical protein
MGILIAYLLGILTASKPKHQDGDSDHTTTSSQSRQHRPDGPISVLCIPPTPTIEEEAEDKKQKRRATIKFRFEIGGGIVLLIYAFFTILIWCANKKSADAAKSAADTAEVTLRMGYRPWVNAESAELVEPLVYPPKQRFYLKLKFGLKNTGTSIATDGVAIAEVSPDDGNAMSKHSGRICNWLEPSKAPAEKNVSPSGKGFVLAPGNVLPFPIGMGSDEISNQQVSNAKFFVLGCLIYRDQFKTWHHTRFCFRPTHPIVDSANIQFDICEWNQEAD